MVSKRKKDKGGRPTVSDAERRDTLVRVLVNVVEWKELQHAAASTSLPVSSWMRVVALERARVMAAAAAADKAK